MPTDFNNTIMYKIVCNDLNVIETYVGHTTNFIQRKCDHKNKCNKEGNKSYNYKVYTTIRENGGWENWSILEIEEYPCNNLNEATARERYWYETLNSTLNTQVPNRTHKEYKEDNAGKIKDYQKEWYKDNADKEKEYKNQYYKQNADKYKQYKKEYREQNKEIINEKQRQYYKQNIEIIREKQRQYRLAKKT